MNDAVRIRPAPSRPKGPDGAAAAGVPSPPAVLLALLVMATPSVGGNVIATVACPVLV